MLVKYVKKNSVKLFEISRVKRAISSERIPVSHRNSDELLFLNVTGQELSEPNPSRGIRQLQQRQQGTVSNTSDHHHDQRVRRQQQHHHHQHAEQSASSSDHVGVAVTGASGRLARIAKSHMYGVQTPFTLSDITALQKQKQSQRQQRQQT